MNLLQSPDPVIILEVHNYTFKANLFVYTAKFA